jgi:glycosyltransferase involved in cell wall biosynthesis
MKILYVSNGSNFAGAGGMEYHLVDITNWLGAKGVDIGLAVRAGTNLHRNLLRGRSNVYPLSWTGLNKIFSFFQLAKVIADFSPDIISINRERDIVRVFFITKIISPFLKKRPKIVAVFHNLGWKRYFPLRKLDGIIYPNKRIKNEYSTRNEVEATKSTVIYHGISLYSVNCEDKFKLDRQRRYFTGITDPIIGMVGELRKNQSELVEVAFFLKKMTPNFMIALVGAGTEEEIKELKEKIRDKGLTGKFVLTGNVDRKRMQDVYFDFDISVTTFRYDAFGLAYIESLSAYTPLIAYNSGGPVEILEKGGGILVKDGPEEMAEKIFSLVSNYELRKSLGRSGRTVAEKYFSLDSMGQNHYDFYKKIAHGHQV